VITEAFPAVKAHTEMIKSIEYLYDEKLIISTGYDKKVKIWNSESGL